MTRRRILAVLLGLCMTGIAWAGAPSIALQDLDGRARNVNEFIGHAKWVVVVTWSHDCRICDREIDEMAAFADDSSAALFGVVHPVVERNITGVDSVVGVEGFLPSDE